MRERGKRGGHSSNPVLSSLAGLRFNNQSFSFVRFLLYHGDDDGAIFAHMSVDGDFERLGGDSLQRHHGDDNERVGKLARRRRRLGGTLLRLDGTLFGGLFGRRVPDMKLNVINLWRKRQMLELVNGIDTNTVGPRSNGAKSNRNLTPTYMIFAA